MRGCEAIDPSFLFMSTQSTKRHLISPSSLRWSLAAIGMCAFTVAELDLFRGHQKAAEPESTSLVTADGDQKRRPINWSATAY